MGLFMDQVNDRLQRRWNLSGTFWLTSLLWIVTLICGQIATGSVAFAQDAESEQRVVWHAYRGAEEKALKKLVESWNEEHPSQPFKLLFIPYEVYASKVDNDIPRGNGPDVFISAHERIGQWAASSLIEPWPVDSLQGYHPKTLDAVRYQQKSWGVPLAYKSLVLFYHRKFVKQPPESVEEMLDVAQRVTDAPAGRYGLVYEAANFYMHAPWLTAFGGEVFDDEGKFALNSPEVAASYAFAEDLVLTRKIVPEDASGSLVTHLFNSGDAAFAINGPWFLGELDKDLDFGMVPLPPLAKTGLPASPFLTVDAAFVSARSTHKEDARQFALYISNHDSSLIRAREGLQPVATLSVYDDPEIQKMGQLMTFRKQLDHTLPMPNRPEMNAVWEPANQALRQVLRGSVEPAMALKQAEQRYGFYTKPAPEEQPMTPLLIGVVLLLLALAATTFMKFRDGSLWAEMKANKPAYLYLAPAAVGMILLIVAPFVVGSMVSLFAHHNGEFTYVGLTHFLNILLSREYGLTDPLSFYFTLAVTVAWTAVNVFFHVSIGLGLALLLREPWVRLRGFYRVLLIIPWAIPNYITALIWKGMFHKQFGAINGLLVALGLEPVSWFSQFSTAFAANVATNTWLGFPFMMVVILGALQAIPRDLEQAAEVDGASWWQRMRHVVFPLLKPSLVPAVILGTVWTFNMFNIIYLVSGGEPDGATEILISESYKWAFTRQQQYGYAAAYAVLIFFVLLAYSAVTGQLKLDD